MTRPSLEDIAESISTIAEQSPETWNVKRTDDQLQGFVERLIGRQELADIELV